MCDAQEWIDPYAERIPRALAGYANTAIRINDKMMRTGVDRDTKGGVFSYDFLSVDPPSLGHIGPKARTGVLGVSDSPYGGVYTYLRNGGTDGSILGWLRSRDPDPR